MDRLWSLYFSCYNYVLQLQCAKIYLMTARSKQQQTNREDPCSSIVVETTPPNNLLSIRASSSDTLIRKWSRSFHLRVIRKGRSSSGLVLAAAVVEVEGSAATLDRWKSRPISCLFHHHPLLLLPQQLLLLLLTVLLPAFEAKVSPLMASWHTTTLMLLLPLLLVLLY